MKKSVIAVTSAVTLLLAGCSAVPKPDQNYLSVEPSPAGEHLAGVWVGISPNTYTQENFVINPDGTGLYCLEYGSNSGVGDFKLVKSGDQAKILFPNWEYSISEGSSSQEKVLKSSLMMTKAMTITKAENKDISSHCRMLFNDVQQLGSS